MRVEANLTGVLFGVAAVIIAAAVFVLIWRKGFQSATVHFGNKVHAELAAINRAVNNVPPNTPPLTERVDLLGEWLSALDKSSTATQTQVAWLVEGLLILGEGLGHEFPTPPPPSPGRT